MRTARPGAASLAALVAALVAACGDPAAPRGGGGRAPDSSSTATPAVPDSLALPVVPGGRLWLFGDARDSLGTEAATPVRFTVDDSTVAVVDSLGQVVGVRAGRATVTAAVGDRRARFAVVVRPVRFGEAHPATEGGCGLSTAGEALCWGGNGIGELGTETYQACTWLGPRAPHVCSSYGSATPVFVRTRERFASLSVSWSRRCGLTADGRAVCWGARPDNAADARPPCDTVTGGRCAYRPAEDAAGHRWRAIATGGLRYQATTCALDEAGAPWCWGLNYFGQTGTERADYALREPAPVASVLRLRAVGVGPFHGCGLDADGAAWCWGYPYAFGNDTTTSGLAMVRHPVAAAGGLRLASLSVSDGTCGLTRDGEAWCWGFATRPAPAAPGLRLAQVSAGATSACGLTAAGDGWCWPYGGAPQPVGQGVRLRTLEIAYDQACGIGLDARAYCIPFEASALPTPRAVGTPRAIAGQP